MARLPFFFGFLLQLHLLCGGLFRPIFADDSSQLLDDINQYRTTVSNVPALTSNSAANCLAGKVLTKYEDTPCTNHTGLDTVPGEELQFSEFPNWLSSCNIAIESTHDGQILTDCIPSADLSTAAATAAFNFTHSVNSQYVNDSMYTSAGVASSKQWFVLLLATNTSSGDYHQSSSSYKKSASAVYLLISFVGSILMFF